MAGCPFAMSEEQHTGRALSFRREADAATRDDHRYSALEDVFRGSRDMLRKRQRP